MEKNILNFYAKTNTGFLHPVGRKATDLLCEFLDCKKGERLLELGFGTGATLCLFASVYKETHFYGLEFSPVMFKKAKALASLCKAKNVTLSLNNNPSKLTFDDDFFDSIYIESVLAIQSDENLELLIKELSRVLKPGGKFLMNEGIWADTMTAKEITKINTICKENFGIIQSNAKYPYSKDWKILLENNGLKLKKLQLLNPDMNTKRIPEPLLSFMVSKLFTWYGKLRSIMHLNYIKEYYNYQKTMKLLNSGKQYLEGYLLFCIKEKTEKLL